MNIEKNSTAPIINLGFLTTVMLLVPLIILSIVALEGILAPVLLLLFMVMLGSILIMAFSGQHEKLFKIKLFIFFFSLYLSYSLFNYYLLINLSQDGSPYVYLDGATFYEFSNLGVPYISGEENFFDLFSIYEISELPLHVAFSAIIAYFSDLVDGNNTILIQKMLSPFLGGFIPVVLYATLKHQFKDHDFSLKATFAYSLLSAVFMYATPMLRDIDITLAYMIYIYIFLQPNKYMNILLLLLVAYITSYLRVESGLVLYGITLIYVYFFVRKVKSISIKFILYILLAVLFSIVLLAMSNNIMGMVTDLNEAKIAKSVETASAGSIGLLLNKLPPPTNFVAKLLFGQIQPFPFIIALDRPPEAIHGIFWPFIFIMMVYAIIKKDIRDLIDTKVKYLLIITIAILFLMSSEPMTRRMLSVYPVIYLTSLYAFLNVPNDKIKRIFIYYIFGIISLNIFYFLIKL